MSSFITLQKAIVIREFSRQRIEWAWSLTVLGRVQSTMGAAATARESLARGRIFEVIW